MILDPETGRTWDDWGDVSAAGVDPRGCVRIKGSRLAQARLMERVTQGIKRQRARTRNRQNRKARSVR